MGASGKSTGRLALLTLLGLAAACQGALAEQCLRYEPDVVSLQGTLQLKAFPGPPHYQSMEFGDQPEAIWMLTLARPICIGALAGDSWNVAREGVQTLEIVPRTSFALSLNGRAVQIQGTLSRAPQGSHRHSDIILRATRVAASSP